MLLRYHGEDRENGAHDRCTSAGRIMNNLLPFQKKPNYLLRTVTWTGVAVSVITLGLLVGRELRVRYKFKHRTPYDYYKHAGDQDPLDSYAVGV
jgi:hypothetical protein